MFVNRNNIYYKKFEDNYLNNLLSYKYEIDLKQILWTKTGSFVEEAAIFIHFQSKLDEINILKSLLLGELIFSLKKVKDGIFFKRDYNRTIYYVNLKLESLKVYDMIKVFFKWNKYDSDFILRILNKRNISFQDKVIVFYIDEFSNFLNLSKVKFDYYNWKKKFQINLKIKQSNIWFLIYLSGYLGILDHLKRRIWKNI